MNFIINLLELIHNDDIVNVSKLLTILNRGLECFPLGASIIPLYIIAVTVHYDQSGEDLSLKVLYSTINKFSSVGVKNHLKQLHEKGWVEIKDSENDGRVKVVRGTKKLHATFLRVFNV